MSKQLYGIKEVRVLLGVSESKGYKLIKQMNQELTEKGYITISGKVPRAYVEARFFGIEAEKEVGA